MIAAAIFLHSVFAPLAGANGQSVDAPARYIIVCVAQQADPTNPGSPEHPNFLQKRSMLAIGVPRPVADGPVTDKPVSFDPVTVEIQDFQNILQGKHLTTAMISSAGYLFDTGREHEDGTILNVQATSDPTQFHILIVGHDDKTSADTIMSRYFLGKCTRFENAEQANAVIDNIKQRQAQQ